MPRPDDPSALPPSLEGSRMLDTGQMAAAIRYCPEHLRRLVRAGKFPKPVRIGGRLLWPASVLVDLGRGEPAGEAADADATEEGRS